MQTQREFFARVLSTEGKPCLAWLVPGSPRPTFTHKAFNSVEDLCKVLDKIDYTKHNFYFSIATLRENSVEENGKRRVRVQSNCLNNRAFVLDVDVRPDKPNHYATKEEALVGIGNVAKALSLPDPIIVDSGFGLHVYWTMAGGIPSAKWTDAARRFKKVIQLIEPKVVADGSRVADCSGLLRIPGSYNLKNGELTPVRIAQWSDDVADFGELSTFLNSVTGAMPTGEDAPGLSGVKPTEQVQSEPVDIKKVARNCNWTKEYLTHSETAGEPEWYAMLGLVPYLFATKKDGSELTGIALAHAISSKHPDYDGEATYAKYQQVRNAQNGPTTCERFRGIDPARCEGCPFATTVKSPVHTAGLARPATEAEVKEVVTTDDDGNKGKEVVTIPLFPHPYFRGESGGVFHRVRKQDAVTKEWSESIEKVYDYDMYPMRRFRTESLENEGMEVHLWLPKDGLRKFKLSNELLADNKALNKFMNGKGVVPEYGKSAAVTKYMVDYVRYLQDHVPSEVEYSHFGWRGTNTSTPKFVVADGYYDCEGNLQPGILAEYLKSRGSDEKAVPPISAVETKGSLEEWKKGFAVYENMDNCDPYILAVLSGFAAPLFGFTEYNGMLYNMVGNKGAGKSSALKVMASVFGIPIENRLRNDDTVISSFNSIGYLNSVAVAFDEITNMEPKHISEFVLAFTGGRGKTRAGQDGHNKVNDTTWGTVVVCTSNTSVIEKYTQHRKGYGAESSRTYEVLVTPAEARYKPHVDRCTGILRNNYGHAGREFLKYIMPRTGAIRDAITRTIAYLDKRYMFLPSERFWTAYFACVIIASKISRDILKLHNYDAEALIDRMLGEGRLLESRKKIESTAADPVSCLGDFFNSNLSSVLRMNNGMVDLGSMSGNMHQIKARIEYVDKKPTFAYVSIASMREYCQARTIDKAWMQQGLEQDKVIVKDGVQFRLTAGTQLPAVNCRCWKIDMNNPKLAGLVLQDGEEDTGDAAAG